jgi:hypothetical protein
MNYDSRVTRFELFVATATLGAHANSSQAGFRQRDVKFLIDLFSNWVESSLHENTLSMQNTQILRFLSGLVEEGFARKLSRKTHPAYRLTRVGLIELVSRIVNRPYHTSREQFFFLVYFIKNYKPRIEEMVKAEGKQFPYPLKLELQGLLDARKLVERELEFSGRELKKLENRINDAVKTSELTKQMLREGAAIEEIVKRAEKLFPYELNSQKPLTELIAGIPSEMRQWELESGNLLRTEDIWRPSKVLLEEYIRELKKLKERFPA